MADHSEEPRPLKAADVQRMDRYRALLSRLAPQVDGLAYVGLALSLGNWIPVIFQWPTWPFNLVVAVSLSAMTVIEWRGL